MKRKISAILAADIVKYSTLVAGAEEETVGRLAAYRAMFEAATARHGGRIVNMVGDAVLAEFPSSVDAVRCAIAVQDAARTHNQAYPANRQMLIRIGVTLADIMDDDGELFGDGVNIAARLESLAPPGGICVSQTVREQVAGKLSVKLDDIGQQRVKNLPEPIRAYVIPPHGETGDAKSWSKSWQRAPGRKVRLLAAAAAVIVAFAGSIVAAVQFHGTGEARNRPARTAEARTGGAAGPSLAAQTSSPAAAALHFDSEKVRTLAASQSIPLPRNLRVLVPAGGVPAHLAEYLGAWGGDQRWNQKGRHVILIVESIDETGTALGFYAHSVPMVPNAVTENSARFIPFAASISEKGLRFGWRQGKYLFVLMPDGSMQGQLDTTNEKGHFDLSIMLNRIE